MNDNEARGFWSFRWVGPCLIVAWVIFAAWYVFSPGYPFGFYTDIGINIATTALIAQTAPHLADTAALASWQPWHDNAAFIYTPMLNYGAAWIFNAVLRDPIRTVKFIQVLQFTLAFASMAWCYGLLFGKNRWRWIAGILYAVLPTTAIMIRQNNDFGWIFALTPAAFAASLWLVKRFGASALPLCAVICTLVSGLLASDYESFLGIPLYVLVCALAGAFGSWRKFAWAAFGLVPLALISSYVILPTFLSAVYGWPPSRIQELQSGAVLGGFSQSIPAALAWIHQENVIPQARMEFYAGGSYWLFVPAGIALWALAIVAAIQNWSHRGALWALAACVSLLALAFGPLLPFFGPIVWFGIAHLPVVNALRTPDRFIVLPAMLGVLGAVWGASYLMTRDSLWVRVAAGAAVAVAIAGFGFGDFREHVLSQQDPEAWMPSLHDVNAAVAQRGGRTASYAFVRTGSIIDTSDSALYGIPAPTIAGYWDLAGGYADGDLGLALLRRSDVRTVITSPTWVYDRPPAMTPDFSLPVAQSGLADRILQTKDGVTVFAIRDPRPMLAQVTPLCVQAGPDLFDRIAGLPDLEQTTLIRGPHPGCAGTAYGNYSPLDAAVPANAIASWTGTQAFKESDGTPPWHAFENGRHFLTVPWYRDAIFGNTPLSKTPFVSGGDGATSKHLVYAVRTPGRYSAYVRMLGIGTVQRVDQSGVVEAIQQDSPQTFKWLEFPLARSAAQTQSIDLHIQREGSRQGLYVVDGVYVAPSSAATRSNMSDGPIVLSPAAFIPEEATAAAQPHGNWNSPLLLFPRPQLGSLTARGQGVVLDAHSGVGYYQGSPAVSSASPNMVVTIPWRGAPGVYKVHVAAWLPGVGSTLSLVTSRQNVTTTYDPTAGIVPTELFATLDLTKDRAFQIKTTALARPGESVGGTLLVLAAIVPLDAALSPTIYQPGFEKWTVDGQYPLSAYAALHAVTSRSARVMDSRQLAVINGEIADAQQAKAAAWRSLAAGGLTPKDLDNRLTSLNALIASLTSARDTARTTNETDFVAHAGTLSAPQGTTDTMHVLPSLASGEAVADLNSTGVGQGTLGLQCGSTTSIARVPAGQTVTSVAVWRDGRAPCYLNIRYDTALFAVTSASITTSGALMTGWSAEQYFPGGRYRWKVTGGNLASLAIDGRVHPSGPPVSISPGYHQIVVAGDSKFSALAFTNTAFSLPPAPAQHPVTQLSPIAWSTHVDGPATLELAQVNDGNWFARVGTTVYRGYHCDLINTCFDVKSSGTALVSRTLPPPVRLGFILSLAALLMALLSIAIPWTLRRTADVPQRAVAGASAPAP